MIDSSSMGQPRGAPLFLWRKPNAAPTLALSPVPGTDQNSAEAVVHDGGPPLFVRVQSAGMGDTSISREQLVDELAAVSHSTWMLQSERDKGADPASLPKEVQPHDLERAEHTVQRLEELGIVVWPNDP